MQNCRLPKFLSTFPCVRSLFKQTLSHTESVEPISLSCVISGSNIGLEGSLKIMAKILKWAAVKVVTVEKCRLYPVNIMARLYIGKA